jgi:hypothetical protein
MDVFNDLYPLYPRNPDLEGLTNQELDERDEYLDKLEEYGTKRRVNLVYDDWYLKYSEDLWYLWCIINEFTDINISPLLCKMEYSNFCIMCYENSTQY